MKLTLCALALAAAAACHGATVSTLKFDTATLSGTTLTEGGRTFPHTGNGGKSYLVTSPVRAGSKALQVNLGANTSEKSREEWYVDSSWKSGQVRTLRFSLYIPADFQAPQNHCALSQVLYQSSVGPPPIYFGVAPSGGQLVYTLYLHSDPNDTYRRVATWTAPVQRGKWVDFAFEAKHSAGSDGYLKAWIDGQLWADHSGRIVKLPTGVANTRIGIYRGIDSNAHKVFFDEVTLTDAPFAGGTVTPTNQAPTITAIADQTTTAGVAKTVSFTIGDDQTAAGSLTLSGDSSDTTLLPLSGLSFSGTGTSRTVTLTPAAGKTGTATVTVTVRDGGGLTASRSFTLTVAASATGTTDALVCVADAYVRDGSYADGNNGGAAELVVKTDASGYNRESYLRFTLDPAAAVDAAVLELTVTGAGSEAAATDFAVELIASDAWGESTLTWKNRPTATIGSAMLVKGAAVGATVRVDVTSHVRETLASDPTGVLTVRIRGTTKGSQRWMAVASREAAAGKPRLALTLVGGAG